jgi:hypothetical protein
MSLAVLFQQKLFLAVLLAGFVSQVLKLVLQKKFHVLDLLVTGGFPSTHAALITSVISGVFVEEGFSSLFILALVVGVIVVIDALGVRRSTGEEGKAINKIILIQKLKISPLHYSIGHKPLDVLGGVVIGYVSAYLVYMVI